MTHGWPPRNPRAVIATMHGKQAQIVPALADLGLVWLPLPEGFDTDRFGTFTRDVPRSGDQRAAAECKALAALEVLPEADFAIASEGSFGPHPAAPFMVGGVELVLLADRSGSIRLEGWDVTLETNFAHRLCDGHEEAERFAQEIGFPEAGLVMLSPDGAMVIEKRIDDHQALLRAMAAGLASHGRIRLESDMRAHRNPLRRRAIARAATRLAEAGAALCPACGAPGFVARQRPGRPCRLCRTPTHEPWEEERTCRSCGTSDRMPIDSERAAEPGLCPACNP